MGLSDDTPSPGQLTIFWSSTRSSAKKSDGSARYLRNPRRNARLTDIFWAWMKLSRIVAGRARNKTTERYFGDERWLSKGLPSLACTYILWQGWTRRGHMPLQLLMYAYGNDIRVYIQFVTPWATLETPLVKLPKRVKSGGEVHIAWRRYDSPRVTPNLFSTVYITLKKTYNSPAYAAC